MADGHDSQRVPQVATAASSTQDAPHAWYPAPQVKPQRPSRHTADPPGGAVHGASQPPQCAGSVAVFTHEVPHRVVVAPPQPLAHAKVPPSPVGAQKGAGSRHDVVQLPQCAEVPSSLSHPSSTRDEQWARPG